MRFRTKEEIDAEFQVMIEASEKLQEELKEQIKQSKMKEKADHFHKVVNKKLKKERKLS